MIEGSRVRIPAGAAGEFSSPWSTFCADSFRYPFHPRVTAVARKRSRSFCQKCRWQVAGKRTCAETAAVSRGTSHAPNSAVRTPLGRILLIRAIKGYNHSFRIFLPSTVSLYGLCGREAPCLLTYYSESHAT